MEKPVKAGKWRFRLRLFFGGLAIILFSLHSLIPANASEEYIYTIDIIFKIAFIPAVLIALLTIRFSGNPLIKYKWLFFALGCLLCIAPLMAPPATDVDWRIKNVLSACWLGCFACLTIFLFALAKGFKEPISTITCLIASIFLCLAIGEGGFLLTRQPHADGYTLDTRHSKYVLEDKAQIATPHIMTPIGYFLKQPSHPSASYAHREKSYDNVNFDVRYTLNAQGHRILPAASDTPEADLLLFGCSFTFGHGLENDQTWPWLLAADLGPRWRVENYAFNGAGAQQMLSLLENKAITPPAAPKRFAFFLGIEHQTFRHTGLFNLNSISYKLENGELRRDGFTNDQPVAIIRKAASLLNGSQLARELSNIFTNAMRKAHHEEYLAAYVAMLAKSHQILLDEYKTTLVVLLWPDLEEIGPALEKAGVAYLEMRPMLPAWNEGAGKGSVYHIVPNVEFHPSTRASAEIAKGLSEWLKARSMN